ncbi:MAG: hypothetical protein ACK56W_20035 [Pirellula sp.]|jgi:hypothetical protein|nr:hypothetical protein [Pirellula sp.]
MDFLKKLLSTIGIGRSKASSDFNASEVAEAYAGVSAGVEINRNCSILSDEETMALEKALDEFTKAIGEKLRPEFISMLRKSAKEMADDPPYIDCAKEACDSVKEAQEVARYWISALEAGNDR